MNFTGKTLLPFLFCSLFFSTFIQSQNTTVDSLKKELYLRTQKDSTRVNLLNELAYSYHKEDFDTAKVYIEESEDIADMIDFKKGKARSLYIKGMARTAQSNFDEGFRFLTRALELYKTINYKLGISECYDGLGLLHVDKGEREEAIEYYLKSVSINETMGNKEGVSASFRFIGVAQMELGNYAKAISSYEKAIQISKEINSEDRISRCLMNIGNVHLVQGNYPLALEFHNKSLTINEKRKDTLLISLSLSNIGHIYRSLENYDKALTYSKRALDIQTKIGDKKRAAETLLNLGITYIEKKDYEQAENVFKEALALSKEIKNKHLMGYALNNIGYVYLKKKDDKTSLKYYEEARIINYNIDSKRGLMASYYGLAYTNANLKKYNVAVSNALKSHQLTQELKILSFERDILQLLSDIYQNTGNYKEAFESHQQFKILNDSLFNKENIEKIAQLEYAYKYKQAIDSASIRELKLTKEVSSINTNLEKSQRNIFLTVIAFLLTALILGGIIFFLKWRNIKERNQNILIEQKLLRSQMTPHFIFNSLSVLQGMILNKEDEKSISYLSKFSKLLRIVLENSRDKLVPLIQELDAIDNYMVLQNLDADPPYNYSLVVDENIDINLFQIPPMLIQPFIENSIAHAFDGQKEHREIVIHLKFIDTKLICTIADNGMGIDAISQKPNVKKKSLATTITSERLLMLAKEFKVPGEITLVDRKKHNERGTLVTLVIPYKINQIL
jgi:sensor histidine kinase YesM